MSLALSGIITFSREEPPRNCWPTTCTMNKLARVVAVMRVLLAR